MGLSSFVLLVSLYSSSPFVLLQLFPHLILVFLSQVFSLPLISFPFIFFVCLYFLVDPSKASLVLSLCVFTPSSWVVLIQSITIKGILIISEVILCLIVISYNIISNDISHRGLSLKMRQNVFLKARGCVTAQLGQQTTKLQLQNKWKNPG